MNGLLTKQQPAAQQPAGRKANPQEQAAYKTMVMQVVKFVAQPDTAEMLEQLAQSQGPARALAFIVAQALQGVGQAAQNAGVDVAQHTGQAALGEILTAIANLMKAGGLVDDVEATVGEAMQLIMTGGQPEQGMPQQQPMGA